jgi:hypothetical protein
VCCGVGSRLDRKVVCIGVAGVGLDDILTMRPVGGRGYRHDTGDIDVANLEMEGGVGNR